MWYTYNINILDRKKSKHNGGYNEISKRIKSSTWIVSDSGKK